MARDLMRFDPFTDLARLDEPLRGMEEFFQNFGLMPFVGNREVTPRITIDVSESDQAYTVKANLPGFKKEDIKIVIDGNQVAISAESKSEKEEKQGETVVRSERYYGRQSRRFTLAHEIDDTKAVAKYEDGVLELSLPKKSGSSGQKQLAIT
jgi:HSP20 family protein